MINCRDLNTPQEFEAAVELEIIVWQMDTGGAVPTHLMQAVAHGGGIALGAFDGDRLVGFTMAFLARQGDTFFPWSHMAGVHPEYQSRGVGFMLKQAQRIRAMQQGYLRIGWTFDPLQRRNAAFNLRHLGGLSNTYHVNFYGEMQDGLNAGAPSDRLEINWKLDDARVVACADGQKLPAITDDPGPLLLEWANDAPVLRLDAGLTAPYYRVEIPYDRTQLRGQNPDHLLAWQMALRTALQTAFAQGYAAVDFESQGQRCWYILQKQKA